MRVRVTARRQSLERKKLSPFTRIFFFGGGGGGCITSKLVYISCVYYIYIYNILLCVLGENDFSVTCVRVLAFSPAAAAAQSPKMFTVHTGIYINIYIYYICIYNIPCRVRSGQKIIPTVIYCRRDTYSLLQAMRRVRVGVGGGCTLGALYIHNIITQYYTWPPWSIFVRFYYYYSLVRSKRRVYLRSVDFRPPTRFLPR